MQAFPLLANLCQFRELPVTCCVLFFLSFPSSPHGLDISKADANSKSKCKLLHSETDFLGFHISEAGVSTQERNVQAIVDRTAPQSVKELKSFLGVLNFHRKYRPDYAALALPLTTLLRKNVKFCWDEAQETAFQELKKRLIPTPVLRYFNPALATCVLVDASDYAIGAVLTQQHDEDLLPVAFSSKRLNSAELNYSVREKELLGLISALLHSSSIGTDAGCWFVRTTRVFSIFSRRVI